VSVVLPESMWALMPMFRSFSSSLIMAVFVGGRVAGLVGEIRYWFSRPQEGVRYNKTVRHYLLRPIGGDPSLHDHEFDEVRWVSVPEALKLLTYENEARMLRQAVEMAGDQGEEETA